MGAMTATDERLARGEFARLLYRLGRSDATGTLILFDAAVRREVLILRRGALCADDARAGLARLARLAMFGPGVARFDGGAHQHPPVPPSRTVPLAPWARQHYEAQLDGSRAEALTAQLAGVRLSVRPELAPPSVMLDEADRRILAAMAQPRRLDQIWPLARTPRFRLLSFVYFLRQVGAVVECGVSAFDSGPHRVVDPRRAAACRLLGVDDGADREVVKRAYRRLARALHPDLHPGVADLRRRELEARLAEVTAAADALLA